MKSQKKVAKVWTFAVNTDKGNVSLQQHLNRQFHTITGDGRKEDSGFFIATTDAHAASVVEKHFEEPLNIVADCETEFIR
ncbi:hypothetical protein DMENIID0001_042260 [Sergentomyia squamirostris]